jgi:hypothetical protein
MMTAIAAAAALACMPALAWQSSERQAQGQGRFSPDRIMEHDTDGDGRVSREELPGRMNRIFDRIDANGDGYLDRAEVEKFFANRAAGRRAGGQEGGGQGAGRQPSFDSHMGTMGRSMRRLSRSEFDAASIRSDLQQVANLQRAIIGAKSTLHTIAATEHGMAEFDGDSAGYRRAFRIQLLATLRATVTLEMAIVDGDKGAAKAAMSKLVATRDDGHARFQPEEEEHDDHDEGHDDDHDADEDHDEDDD